MAFHHPLLDGIVVAAVVHEVPRLVGNVTRGLRRGLAAEHVHEAQLERLAAAPPDRPEASSEAALRWPRATSWWRARGGCATSSGPRAWTPYSPGVARLHLLRVFCDEHGCGGNALGVFLDGAEVPAERRQGVAAELGLSETVFVDDAGAGSIRIFTPAAELDFAGHPTVGTAWLLARERAAGGGAAAAGGRGARALLGRRDLRRRPPGMGPAVRVVAAGVRGGGRTAVAARRVDENMVVAWAYADEDAGIVRLRVFPQAVGIAEDEATGSAAVQLASPARARDRDPAGPRLADTSRARPATGVPRSAAAACSTRCATTPFRDAGHACGRARVRRVSRGDRRPAAPGADSRPQPDDGPVHARVPGGRGRRGRLLQRGRRRAARAALRGVRPDAARGVEHGVRADELERRAARRSSSCRSRRRCGAGGPRTTASGSSRSTTPSTRSR